MIESLTGSGDDDQTSGDDLPPVRYLHAPPSPPRAHQYNELLGRLMGYTLRSVQFVRGFVQFGFGTPESLDVPVLTCEVMPVVNTPSGPIADGQPGYADAIRAMVGHTVVDTAEAPGQGLRIDFAQHALEVRPTAADAVGPVIALLSDFRDGRSVSWRPGGEAFEYLR
jgi:hypothetical protein